MVAINSASSPKRNPKKGIRGTLEYITEKERERSQTSRREDASEAGEGVQGVAGTSEYGKGQGWDR